MKNQKDGICNMEWRVDSIGRFVVVSDYDNDVIDLGLSDVEDILEEMKRKRQKVREEVLNEKPEGWQ
jgi:hypothetical protein